jgi:hypothetical protein
LLALLKSNSNVQRTPYHPECSCFQSARTIGWHPIEHLIFIVQENHSFDNYFGTYPGANGIPAGTALPDYPGGPLVNPPYHETATNISHDLPHGWLCYRVAWDNGAMDGFLYAEYPYGYNYYGKEIPVPTPNADLVKIVKRKGKTSTKDPSLRVGDEYLSPHGFTDDEDDDAPWVEEANDELAKAEASPSGTPNWQKRAQLGSGDAQLHGPEQHSQLLGVRR